MRRLRQFAVLIVLVFPLAGRSQDEYADSLKQLLANSSHDTVRCRLLAELITNEAEDKVWLPYNDQLRKIATRNLSHIHKGDPLFMIYMDYYNQTLSNEGFHYYRLGQFDSAGRIFQRAYNIAMDAGDERSAAYVLNDIGAIHEIRGDYLKALESFERSYQIHKKQDDKTGMAASVGNIGVIYMRQGYLTKALKYFNEGVRLQKITHHMSALSSSYNNIGTVYRDMGDLAKAEEAFLDGLQVNLEAGSKNGQALSYNRLGGIELLKHDTAAALKFIEKGLALQIEIEDAVGKASTLMLFGDIYKGRRQFKEALKIYDDALSIFRETGDVNMEANVLCRTASCLLQMGEKERALADGLRSLEIAKRLQSPKPISEAALVLKKIYAAMNKPAEALQMFELYVVQEDSINSAEARKAILKTQLKFEFEKRETALKQEQEKQLLVVRQHEARNRLIIWFVVAGILMSVAFAVVIYRRLEITRRQKRIIEEQKNTVEEHRKEIMDSINYARRIQFALLAGDELLQQHLQQHFVFFKPRDVVSGDFYWAADTEDGFIYITADCTGHGVPGAFMSLLFISKLSKIIKEDKIIRPDLILNRLRDEIIEALNPGGNSESAKDGMDAIVCKISPDRKQLQYAAANNSFVVIRNGEPLECKADKMPVGKGFQDETPFSLGQMSLMEGDAIYTFSDGFADQFGGPAGKKFKYRQLEELLIEVSRMDISLQKLVLAERFESWKGDLEQVDDVCVIGVRV